MAKIDAMARSLAEVVCLSGAAVQGKWFPMNVSGNGALSVWWVKITAGCSKFDAYVYDRYEGYGAWYSQKWGGGSYYTVYSVMEDHTSPPVVYDQTLYQRVRDNDFSAYDTGWLWDPPPDCTLRLTGRRLMRRFCDMGCTTECGPAGRCVTYFLSSLVSSTGSLIVANSKHEPEELYLPDPVPFDAAGISAGLTGVGTDGYGSGVYPVVCGTARSVADYTGYLNAGSLALLGADIESTGPGVDIIAPFIEPEKINLVKSGGDDQSRTVTKPLQQLLTARVNDAQGNPKTGVAVSFQVKGSPQGQIGFAVNQAQPTTDAQGLISANVSLGNKAGTYEISATCNDCEPKEVVFRANATPAALIKYSGDQQIGVVGGIITDPLILKTGDRITNETVSNMGINFQITNAPVGATDQSLTKSSETTNADGLADVILKLGNIPAEYGVTATCENCEASANSVTFTCCGKLPNDHFAQGGQAWSPLPYARHTASELYGTIGWLGCGVTSLATLINFYNGSVNSTIPRTDPGQLNGYLRNHAGYTEDNSVKFDAIEEYSNNSVLYLGRYDVGELYSRADLLVMADASILNGNPIIFRIGGHFVLAVGKCGNSYIIADPIRGIERLYNPDDLTDREFRGIRLFGF